MNVIQYEANIALSDVGAQTKDHEREKTPDSITSVRSSIRSSHAVDIHFQSICFTASLGFRKGKKEILHNVDGRFPAGKLIAIMGPSGAGKSTLLDVLSGYRISGVNGTILVDGRERNLNEFRRMSCYIQQDDRLQPLLTTEENMHIAADLKLSIDTPKKEKIKIVNEILQKLNLYKAKETRTGMLSGGQKKRLSIALELINNPVVMFLDEPTTGLDSSTCKDVVTHLKELAQQGRTIVCTIHQPSASLFQLFDQVYILAGGKCAYQGSTTKLVPFLENAGMPCPKYHNPADYAIELACGEYGDDKIETMVATTDNGKKWDYFENPWELSEPKNPGVRRSPSSDDRASRSPSSDKRAIRSPSTDDISIISSSNLQETSLGNQILVLLRQGYIKAVRDSTLTHLRILINIFTGGMLGLLYWNGGNDNSRILNNYNLMFAILIHHMMSTMMLTILTFPRELDIIIKEHFNRWYSLKAYYTAMTIVDLPVTIVACFCFTLVVYFMSGQPQDVDRFFKFFLVSLLVVLTAQGFGLMVGAVLDVVNGTFLGPTLSVPMMMFSGFGVIIRDLPVYMRWGTYVSYLRYGLEGCVGAIYGNDREPLECPQETFCRYRKPGDFLTAVDMRSDRYNIDIAVLIFIIVLFRLTAFLLLKWKLISIR